MRDELRIGFRDAIHVPFVVVKCGTELSPGDKCSLRGNEYGLSCVLWNGAPDGMERVFDELGPTEPMWHGVVDPFLEASVDAETPFRLFIRKECFQGMRHDFRIEVHDRGGTSTCHSVCDVW